MAEEITVQELKYPKPDGIGNYFGQKIFLHYPTNEGTRQNYINAFIYSKESSEGEIGYKDKRFSEYICITTSQGYKHEIEMKNKGFTSPPEFFRKNFNKMPTTNKQDIFERLTPEAKSFLERILGEQ
jgi:hypothetical protein